MPSSSRFLTGTRFPAKKVLLPLTCSERAPGSGDQLLAPRPDRLMSVDDPLYTWLRRLRTKRQIGEARRLFYVAVTRARRELVLSAVVRKKGGGFSTGGQGALGWLDEHFALDELAAMAEINCSREEQATADTTGRWKRTAQYQDSFRVLVEPEPDVSTARPGQTVSVEIDLAPFEREKPAFRVIAPSSLAVLAREAEQPDENEAQSKLLGCAPVLWGTIVHRLFAGIRKKGSFLPPGKSALFCGGKGLRRRSPSRLRNAPFRR